LKGIIGRNIVTTRNGHTSITGSGGGRGAGRGPGPCKEMPLPCKYLIEIIKKKI